MKKTIHIICILVLLNLFTVSAYYYNITYECAIGDCVEDEPMIWNIHIFNTGLNRLEFVDMEIYDLLTNRTVAAFNADFRPKNSDRGNLIISYPEMKIDLALNGTVPKANMGNDFYFFPCFSLATPSNARSHRPIDIYKLWHCYVENESMPVVECAENLHCEEDRYCNNSVCIELECNSCQFILDHTCNDYECCNKDMCEYDYTCINKTCVGLDCGFDQYYQNHTCQNLTCPENNLIIDHQCFENNCSLDEFIYNFSCQKLDCNEDEYIEDHECNRLNCKKNEYAKNHTCEPIDCRYNETYLNNKCMPLDCRFYQKILDHECVTDKPFFYKLIGELIALTLIIFFLLIDFRKYESHKKEKN